MARLADPSGAFIDLLVVGYEFPDCDQPHDSNWLMIGITVFDGERVWSGFEPALETTELEDLVTWLRAADATPGTGRSFYATEPTIAFWCDGSHDDVCISGSIVGPLRSAPYVSPSEPVERPVGMPHRIPLTPGTAAIHQFASELERELVQCPTRYVIDPGGYESYEDA